MRKLNAWLLPAVLLCGGQLMVVGQEAPRTAAPAAASAATPAATPVATPAPGQISEADLGNLLSALGLVPTKTEQRYDFAFKTSIDGEEWKFSMSAVLSRNGESVWVMAWLDQIPTSANDVPRTALLRLLAANDRLGNGKFFAYIPTNKRFVLQRVVKNEEMTSKKVRELLQDLAASVADEHPTWSVANWAPKADQQVAEDESGARPGAPANPTAANRSATGGSPPQPTRTSENGSKFNGKSIN